VIGESGINGLLTSKPDNGFKASQTKTIMLDNIDIAILSKVNEVADRYGLKPYDFVATVQPIQDQGKSMLAFEIPAQGNALRESRYRKMIQSIGVDEDTGTLEGSATHIIDALDDALRLAPTERRRF